MIHLLTLLLSFGTPAAGRCDIGVTGRCYTSTPFGKLARVPTLAEAFPVSARSK